MLKPTALGCIDKLTFELDLKFSGFSGLREGYSRERKDRCRREGHIVEREKGSMWLMQGVCRDRRT